MIKGSQRRQADHQIDQLFLDRWSPRAMSGEAISEADLMVLFEAARWAPSSYNNQPWRLLYARRDTPHWALFFELLGDFNKLWCAQAAVLVLFISKKTFDHNGEPSATHSFDTGAAWQNLALQAASKGYVAHGMQGFDYERAQQALDIPAEYQVEAMVAIGVPASPDTLPEGLRGREAPSTRRPLSETINEGPFALS